MVQPSLAVEPNTAASRKLRILAVTNLWPEKGSYRGVFVERQVAALRELGHHVDVEVVAQSRGRLDYLLAVPRVRARARAGGYDIVHVHYGLAALAARFVGRLPRVISYYGSDINAPRQRLMTRLGSGGSAARIYVASRLAQTAGDDAGHVVANGVDFEVFVPGDQAAARAELGLATDVPVVLFGAEPSRPVKGYDVFKDVLAELDRRGVRVQELILSAPKQPTSGLVTKYNAADVMVFTSRQGSEGSPTVVKEAVAMGLPVVTVDVGDVADVLNGVSPGAVVNFPAKADGVAARRELVAGLADEACKVLAAHGRANGRESSAWLDERAVAARVADIYLKVLSR